MVNTQGLVIPFRRKYAKSVGAARQEYVLAEQHFKEVCSKYEARDKEHQTRFMAAIERREAAFQGYMRAFDASHDKKTPPPPKAS